MESKKDRPLTRTYRRRLGWVPWIELVIGCYFAATIVYAIQNDNYLTVPFLCLFVLGYWYTGLMSLLQGRFERKEPGRAEPQAAESYAVSAKAS